MDEETRRLLIEVMHRNADSIKVSDADKLRMEHNAAIDPTFKEYACSESSDSDSESDGDNSTGIQIGQSYLDEIAKLRTATSENVPEVVTK